MRADATGDEPLQAACRAIGLDSSDARPLRSHSASVYLLPESGVVVRISPEGTTPDVVHRAVQVTSWLVSQGFPAVGPVAGIRQPVEISSKVISFWLYRKPGVDGSSPGVGELGHLLRQLHRLPAPPVPLPAYRPLVAFQESLTSTRSIPGSDRAWLFDESAALLKAYAELDSPLGHGHVHGDAYPGNLLGSVADPALGDWEETATGPRELDLANTFQGVRFGRTDAELDAFTAAYGHDPRGWSGLPTLVAIRDLHTLGSYMRRADAGDNDAGDELVRRVASLRQGDQAARWAAA